MNSGEARRVPKIMACCFPVSTRGLETEAREFFERRADESPLFCFPDDTREGRLGTLAVLKRKLHPRWSTKSLVVMSQSARSG